MMIQDLQEERKDSPFISLLSDSLTDRSSAEEEIVYIRYIIQGVPVVRFLGLSRLESCKAPDILSSILECAMRVGLSSDIISKCLVGFGADGASVMMGCHNGVAALLKGLAPQVIEVHCVAHKLELALCDAVKAIPFLDSFERALKSVYSF